MLSQRRWRFAFIGIAIFLLVILLLTNISVSAGTNKSFQDRTHLPPGDREALTAETDGITVVTSQEGHIVGINPNGTLRYHDNKYDGYYDVDPVPNTTATVLFSAIKKIESNNTCKPVRNICIRQVIARTNLTTGETSVLHTRVDPLGRASEWHDTERLSDQRVLVADMYRDEVFVVNTTTGITTWRWELQQYLPLSTGGPYPTDWAHLNDIEKLGDGRILISLRNQDRVIFLFQNGTVQESWTLGSENNYSTLYEQHNPDYIPPEKGGPAILVADSENNRVVEYSRQNGTWVKTWKWQDRHLDWPRDADRLPDGRTLITDSLGNRVIEVDKRGDIVWKLKISKAYDAERLHTGGESTGGSSAVNSELKSRTPSKPPSPGSAFEAEVRSLFPIKVIHGLKHITPGWMGFYDLGILVCLSVTLLLWAGIEIYWSDIEIQSPIVRR